MNLKRTLQIEKKKNDKGAMALLAWELVGLLVAITAVITVVGMIPELTRYLKLKNM